MPICDVLGSVTANSAFHGTRLDVEHISGAMEELVEQAESRGLRREEIAGETVFVSHETYTPARGGSAAAEIHALRDVFGDQADRIVIANVKGFTGHPMGVGLEDVLAVKALETGVVPPVPNFREPDPELGLLNLSGGGSYPIRYALRLAAGFGSQISMLLLRWTPVADRRRRNVDELGYDYRIADRAVWTTWLDGSAVTRTRSWRWCSTGCASSIRVRPAAGGWSRWWSRTRRRRRSSRQCWRPSPPAPEPTPAPAPGGVEQRVLEIVAEETGYPPDLLDMDLDLEADLGIDTVKQAEVFAKIREAYGIERDDSLQLRDYPTLTRVVAFVNERSGAAAPAPASEPAPAPAPEPTPAPAPGGVEQRVLEIVAEETGYPPDLLDMDLDLEADLGIDTVKQAEVFATIREAYGIERDDSLQLRDYPTLTRVVAFVNERSGAAAPAPASAARARPGPPSPLPRPRRAASSSGCWRSSPRRPAIRPTCSTWTSTSRPTSGSTRSSRPRSSPRSARPTGSSATTRCSCATTRP